MESSENLESEAQQAEFPPDLVSSDITEEERAILKQTRDVVWNQTNIGSALSRHIQTYLARPTDSQGNGAKVIKPLLPKDAVVWVEKTRHEFHDLKSLVIEYRAEDLHDHDTHVGGITLLFEDDGELQPFLRDISQPELEALQALPTLDSTRIRPSDPTLPPPPPAA